MYRNIHDADALDRRDLPGQKVVRIAPRDNLRLGSHGGSLLQIKLALTAPVRDRRWQRFRLACRWTRTCVTTRRGGDSCELQKRNLVCQEVKAFSMSRKVVGCLSLLRSNLEIRELRVLRTEQIRIERNQRKIAA